MGDMIIRAQSAPWHSGVELAVMSSNKQAVAIDVTMQIIEEGTIVEPLFKLTIQQAQVLIDDLWNSGLRPSEGAGSAGAMSAQENHLNDMRAIVAKSLSVDLPRRR